MMRWVLASLIVSKIFLAVSFAGNTANDINKERWQMAFISQIKIIEEKHGIKFDPEWKPKLIFEIPDDIPPQLRFNFGAQYIPESQSFAVSPSEEREVDLSLIAHELGHALVDQISRRAGNGMWPNIQSFTNLEWDERMGISIISEGIGTYFEYHGIAPYPSDELHGFGWLPKGEGDLIWQQRDYLYNEGRWLVAPIIEKFGERGILYLVTHPLRFKDYKLRSAAMEYQRLALEQLAKK